MPAGMWRHDINAFLEDLRHRLPESLKYMLAFIYIAYSMMALLYETAPAFEDTWIECLGGLRRYRMAIEDDEPRDREVWSNVARLWYNKAADNSPRVGRSYHHLAILARPYSLEQLSLYIRALTCPIESACGSVTTLFSPILNGKETFARRPTSLETILIKAHGVLFTSEPLQSRVLSGTYTTGLGSSSLDVVFNKAHGIFSHGNPMTPGWNNCSGDYFPAKTSEFTERGDYTAVTNIEAILEHGSSRNEMSRRPLQRVYEDIPHRNLDGSEPVIATGTQDESSTKHQLISTFPDLLRSALDRISYWNLRLTLRGKASRHIRWCPVRAASKLRGSLALTLTTCTNFVVPTTARTIPRNTSNEGSTGSFTAAVVPLAHWPYLAFVIITLLVTQYLAHTKDPLFVWGSMMSVWAFGWWTIRSDSSTSLQISAVVLFLWAISAYQYGRVAFIKHRIPARAGVIIIIAAMILDVSTVTLMTPSEASTAQPELLLSLSLPLVSLILAAMVNTVAAMQSAEQTHQLETGLKGHVPYIQEQCLQKTEQRHFRMPVETPSRPVELPTTPSEGKTLKGLSAATFVVRYAGFYIYIAYSMMAKLHDTVAVVEDTWIKCLSDLGSYLTARKEEGPRRDDTASCSLISSI